MSSTYIPNAVVFLRKHFGLKIEFSDPDLTELTIAARSISVDELFLVLEQYKERIGSLLRRERDILLEICIGGPLNGKSYHNLISYFQRGGVIPFHIERSVWAVYQIGDDNHRAWFKGYATSKKKARKLQLVKEL